MRDVRRETSDTVTVTLTPPAGAQPFHPGQFNMLYVLGVGEAAISMSGDPARRDALEHTVRAVGSVTVAIVGLRRGGALGVRGPFGSGWPLAAAAGQDVVIVSGGLGLAPLRPVLYHLTHDRSRYGRVTLLHGARSPADLLYATELERWSAGGDVDVRLAVDRAGRAWSGHIGLVTSLIAETAIAPERTIALVCGPEVMMRLALRELVSRGMSEERLWVSLERNMQCATGVCGHCQLGPAFVCMDGPIFRYDRIRPFLWIREA